MVNQPTNNGTPADEAQATVLQERMDALLTQFFSSETPAGLSDKSFLKQAESPSVMPEIPRRTASPRGAGVVVALAAAACLLIAVLPGSGSDTGSATTDATDDQTPTVPAADTDRLMNVSSGDGSGENVVDETGLTMEELEAFQSSDCGQ